MNRGQSMNAIAQIAHLLGGTTPRMYLCRVREDTGQCSVCRHVPRVVCYIHKYVANYLVCGILFNLKHVLGSVRSFFMLLFLLFFVVSLATAPGYDHQTASQVKVSV